MNKEQLTLGSLFDGIGGFPYAASFYGIRPLWASEIIPECISVTQKHFVAALLKDGRARLTGCYSEKTGKTYDADVLLEDTGEYVNFKLDFGQRKGGPS